MMKEVNKKRKDLSLQEKLNILGYYDKLPKMSQRSAAVYLNISQPLLCKILKNRSSIEKLALSNENIDRKRVRSGKDSQIESALKIWFGNVREKNTAINGPLMRQKAEEFAKEMGKTNFTPTEGWFNRWKRRENIVYKRVNGEGKRANISSAEMWIKTEWPKIIAEYSPEDIYNADETGIYFRAMPEHAYSLKNENAKGFKCSKEQMTVLCCTNMKGQKRELVVIGKSKNPPCFKGVKSLPVRYCSNANAWMTTDIFNNWLLMWDLELKRKIVLLVDNCLAHRNNLSLKNIKLILLPSETTLIQPCDQGITRTLKAYYRREICRRILPEIDDSQSQSDVNAIAKQIFLLDVLHMLAMSWDQVSVKTIENCFKKSGFCKTNTETIDNKELELITNEILDRNPDDMLKEEFDYWLAIDDKVEVEATMTVSEICQAVTDADSKLEENKLNPEEEIPEIPTDAQMREALKILRRGVQHRSVEFQKQYEYERFINELLNVNGTHKQQWVSFFFFFK